MTLLTECLITNHMYNGAHPYVWVDVLPGGSVE